MSHFLLSGIAMRLKIFASFFVFAAAVSAQAAYRPSDSVSVMWKPGVIRSESVYSAKYDDNGAPAKFGRGDTINRRRMHAYDVSAQKAREMISAAMSAVRVDSRYTFGDLVLDNPDMQPSVADLLDERLKLKQLPGDFFSTRSSAELKLSDMLRVLPYEFPNEDIPVPADKALETKYSSLIIDARGRSIIPMLIPSIYDEDGLEIYGRYYIDSSFAAREGVVSYCFSEKEAYSHRKCGERPYFASALREISGNPVISHRDIRRILSHPSNIINLKKCKVIFIIDKNR